MQQQMQPNPSDHIQPHLTELTIQQLQAIDLFSQGQKVGRIAEQLDISRDTLWRWRRQESFAAALASAQRQQRERMRDHTAELLRLSLLAITRELKKAESGRTNDTTLKAAFRTLNFMSNSGLMRTIAPGDAAWYEAPPELTQEDEELDEITPADREILAAWFE